MATYTASPDLLSKIKAHVLINSYEGDVFFPLSVPGLLAGSVLIFVMSLGYYVIPAFLGGGRILMWSMKIASNINTYGDWGAASALGVVMLLIAIAGLSLLRVLVGSAARHAA